MWKLVVRILLAALLFAVAAAAFLLLGRGQEQQDRGTVKIGVSLYKGDDTFISNMMASFRETAAQFETETGAKINLNMSDAQESQNTQNQQIERYISLGYDVLCVNLVDRTDAAHIIDKAKESGTPVVFFNREPVQADLMKWDRIYYVGSDARESARLEAQIVIDAWAADQGSIDKNGDGVIQYIMLEGESRHQDAVIRTEVSIETLKKAGLAVEKLDGGIANWDRSQAAALVETYFGEYGDAIELIICNNDDMALGAADAIERLGIPFNRIVGIDGTPAGIKAVEEGKLLGTVLMDLSRHAEAIFRLAYALAIDSPDITGAFGIGQDKSIRVPMRIFTADAQ